MLSGCLFRSELSHRRSLLDELRHMKEHDLPGLRQEIAVVRLKASLGGGFMGATPALVAAVAWFLTQ